MSQTYQHITYSALNSPQMESYNFHKIAARLADYGFNCIPLNDDWLGADFLASHIDGKTFLKVQQKGRFTLDKRYIGKDLHIAFRHGDDVYVYPHDTILAQMVAWGTANGKFVNTASWAKGAFSWGSLSAENLKMLEPYKFVAPP